METIQNASCGAALRIVRAQLGWGRRTLARRAQIGHRYLRRVECGRASASPQWLAHVMSVMSAELIARAAVSTS